MRAIVHADIAATARVILAVPETERSALAQRMLREAHWADHFVKRTGRVHRLWGNGTLRAAAYRRRLAAEPDAGDREYCRCLALVLDLVIARYWSALE
jgi:hypothetical protein